MRSAVRIDEHDTRINECGYIGFKRNINEISRALDSYPVILAPSLAPSRVIGRRYSSGEVEDGIAAFYGASQRCWIKQACLNRLDTCCPKTRLVAGVPSKRADAMTSVNQQPRNRPP